MLAFRHRIRKRKSTTFSGSDATGSNGQLFGKLGITHRNAMLHFPAHDLPVSAGSQQHAPVTRPDDAAHRQPAVVAIETQLRYVFATARCLECAACLAIGGAVEWSEAVKHSDGRTTGLMSRSHSTSTAGIGRHCQVQ